MKKKIALIFGGKSVERDISVITAVQTYKALDDKKYAVTPIFIYEGDFYTGNLKTLKDFAPFVPTAHKKLTLLGGKFCQVKKNKLIPIFKPDVVVNCCHGGEGENGTLAGVLEFNDLPHTSPGVLPSAICMDKTASKVPARSPRKGRKRLAFSATSAPMPGLHEQKKGSPLAVRRGIFLICFRMSASTAFSGSRGIL